MNGALATTPEFTDEIQQANLGIDAEKDAPMTSTSHHNRFLEDPTCVKGAAPRQELPSPAEMSHPAIPAAEPLTPLTQTQPDLADRPLATCQIKLIPPLVGELPPTVPVIASTLPQIDGASPSTTPLKPETSRPHPTSARPPDPPSNPPPSRAQHHHGGSTTRPNPIATHALAAAVDNASWLEEIPSVPVYTPTAAEWADPFAYIHSIQAEAGKYGACVVKAPVAPAVPAAIMLKDLRFSTRLQSLKDVPWGKTWDEGSKYYERGRRCTLSEYAKAADEFARKKLGVAAELPTRTAEALYWKEREGRPGRECTVEYGNDVEGTAFCPGDPLGSSNWNLNVS